MRTFSEIDTKAKRASKAMGFSWGIAEEIGKNIRLLELFGLPGIKHLNQYFIDYKTKQFQKVSLITKLNQSTKIPYCPIIFGINFIDQSSILEELIEIEVKNIAYPLLFLPYLSRASEIIGKRIFLKVDEKEYLLNFNQSILSSHLNTNMNENAKLISLKFLENEDSFTKNEWNNLYKLSEYTFVKETDSLKEKGAGAGSIDND